MKKRFLIPIFCLLSVTMVAQEKSVISDLDELRLDIGQTYKPTTYSVDNQGKKYDCERVIYYYKKGAFSMTGKVMEFNRAKGTIKAVEPGYHEVVAICYGSGKSIRRTFNVTINYPKVKSIEILTGNETIYTDNYIPLSYKITDQMDVVRDIDYWKSDNAERYFSNLEFSISSSNDKLEIDDSNNVLAVKSGSATINVVFDGVKSSKTINIKKNNVKMVQIEFNWHNLFTNNTIYQISDILDNYVVTQLNLLNGKLIPKDKKHYFSNIFQLSNFIFVEKKFFMENKNYLLS